MSGVNWTLAAAQSLNLLILVEWVVLAIAALVGLRRCRMDQTARALWALVVLLVPIVGALAFFVVEPGRRDLEGE